MTTACKIIHYQFSKIINASSSAIIAEQNEKAIELAKARHNIACKALAEKQRELLSFDAIADVDKETALSYSIEFNSINIRAKDAYVYGRMFLESIHATLSAGTTQMYTMLFNMDQLYELFVYRVAALIFGNKVTYQKMGNYMVSRVSDGKRFVCLRPDLTLKVSDAEQWIIDTKWKMPNRFAKESDIYQMNAYSSAIKDVNKVILLYPRVAKTDKIVGSYSFISATGINKPLEIKVIDLMECLSWSDFLKSFKSSIIT